MAGRDRIAHLVLSDPQGQVLGRLPPLAIAGEPWWQDAAPLVAAVRQRDGIEIVVLRLLAADRPRPPGGNVVYLAETEAAPAGLAPWDGALGDHPFRLAYARPGGPAADLAWGRAAMDAAGIVSAGPPEQIRTWSLSSLWRLPTGDGALWLKVVPPFFAHEGRLMTALTDCPRPEIVATEGPRLLLRETRGGHLDEGDAAGLRAMVAALVRVQAGWAGREAELFGLGLGDWRAEAATAALADVVARCAAGFDAADRTRLKRFADDLPRRFAALESCGLPDTLVHGDFHPGNGLIDGRRVVLIDFGDCVVGHPLLDLCTFLPRVSARIRRRVEDAWLAAWRRARPGSDPARALRVIAPVAAARQAAVYQAFLDAIEPAEHPYHAAEPANWLRRTLDVLADEHAAAQKGSRRGCLLL